MQRRKFLALFGLGGAVCAAPVAAATIAVVNAGRDEISAKIPAIPPPPVTNNITFSNVSWNSVQYGESSYAKMKIGLDKTHTEQPILQFKVDDVTMNSVKFVEIENGNYVMMFEKEKLNESKTGQKIA